MLTYNKVVLADCIVHKKLNTKKWNQIFQLMDDCDKFHDQFSKQGNDCVESDVVVPSRNRIVRLLKEINTFVFYAQDDNIVRGIVIAGKAKNVSESFIHMVFISESYRSTRVGSVLMQQAEEWLLNEGASSIELGVMSENKKAIDFYHKKGFNISSHSMIKELI